MPVRKHVEQRESLDQFRTRVRLLPPPPFNLLKTKGGVWDAGTVPAVSTKRHTVIIAVLKKRGPTRTLVDGSGPAQSIIRIPEEQGIDLLMMVSHGRGGVARQEHVELGSVVDTVLQATTCPAFLVSARAPAP